MIASAWPNGSAYTWLSLVLRTGVSEGARRNCGSRVHPAYAESRTLGSRGRTDDRQSERCPAGSGALRPRRRPKQSFPGAGPRTRPGPGLEDSTKQALKPGTSRGPLCNWRMLRAQETLNGGTRLLDVAGEVAVAPSTHDPVRPAVYATADRAVADVTVQVVMAHG